MYEYDESQELYTDKRPEYKNYAPVCYLRTEPDLSVPDAFHHVNAERLQSYGRANGHQKLWMQNSLFLLAGPQRSERRQ